jgi:LacI family transcriptional regulator
MNETKVVFQMTTIRDVAKFAGVSVATVSRVINGSGAVNADTRRKVDLAVEQLNYRPNNVARTLFKGSSQMISLFVPDIMNPFFPELARAVEDIATQHGYTFVLCNTDDDLKKIHAYTNALQQKSVDGMIIVSSAITEKYCGELKVPVILLDRIFSSEISAVTVDSYQGGRAATEYLMGLGCRRIAHLSGAEKASNTITRMQGYLDVVSREDWFSDDYIVAGEYNFQKAKEATIRLLTYHPEVDGIFAANDVMGLGAIKAASELGIDIPNELSIIGFDGIAMGEIATPSLTTMQQPIYDMGVRAAEMLIEQIKDPALAVKAEQFPVRLVKRQSTKRKRNANG